MVGIAQLVEHLVVVQDVAGSSPVTHPKNSALTACGAKAAGRRGEILWSVEALKTRTACGAKAAGRRGFKSRHSPQDG